MYEFSRPLGDAVKRARLDQKLSQRQVAEMIDVDDRTVMHIENYKANPRMEVLYPLIRELKIDSHEIFNPELQQANPAIHRLHLLIADCNEQEAEALAVAVEVILSVMRSNDVSLINQHQ